MRRGVRDKDTVVISEIVGGEDILNRNNFRKYLIKALRDELCRDFTVELKFNELDVEEYIAEPDKQQKEITEKKIAETPLFRSPPARRRPQVCSLASRLQPLLYLFLHWYLLRTMLRPKHMLSRARF